MFYTISIMKIFWYSTKSTSYSIDFLVFLFIADNKKYLLPEHCLFDSETWYIWCRKNNLRKLLRTVLMKIYYFWCQKKAFRWQKEIFWVPEKLEPFNNFEIRDVRKRENVKFVTRLEIWIMHQTYTVYW